MKKFISSSVLLFFGLLFIQIPISYAEQTKEEDINYYFEELVYTLNQDGSLDFLKENGLIYLYDGKINIGIEDESQTDLKIKEILKKVEEMIPSSMLKIANEGVPYSDQDYKKLSEEIFESLKKSQIDVLGVTYDVITRKIIAKIPENTEFREKISDVSLFIPHYEMLEFEYLDELPANERARNSDYNNMGGGIALSRDPYNFEFAPWCTLTASVSHGTDFYVLTAGHCFDDVSNQAVYQYGQLLGRIQQLI